MHLLPVKFVDICLEKTTGKHIYTDTQFFVVEKKGPVITGAIIMSFAWDCFQGRLADMATGARIP